MNHIHRDVKPSNILFDLKGNAFLADFGIVKALIADADQVEGRGFNALFVSDPLSINNEASRLMGTPGYMAPELLEKTGISPKSDQFGLAVIVYESIVGRRPYDENLSGGLPADSARQDISLLSDVSAKFKEAVFCGLARNPNDRFPSLEAFASAIVDSIQSVIGNKTHVNTYRAIKCPTCRGTNQLPLGRQEEPFCCSHCGVSLISFGVQKESLIQRVWVYSVEGYRERGLLYAEKGCHSLAIADLTTAIHLGGDDEILYYKRGLSYLSIGKYPDAIEDFNTAITLNFRLKQAFEKRREAYELLGDADCAGSSNESVSGRQDTQRIISNHKVPTRVIALVSRGTSHFASGEFKDAIVILSEAIKQSPYFVNPRVWRGRSCHELGDYSQAIVDFTEAIRLERDQPSHHFLRGRAHYQSDDYSQAIVDFTEAIRLDPLESSHHFWRGHSHYQSGGYSQAIADFTEAIRLGPDQSWHHFWRGQAQYQSGDYTQAIADFTDAIRLESGESSHHLGRGQAQYQSGDYTQAIADITEAIRLGPDQSWHYHWRGLAYCQSDDYSQAIVDFTEAIRLGPDQSWHHFWRGQAQYQIDDYSQAIADFSEAIRLELGESSHHHWRGRSYHELGDYSLAIVDFTAAIRLEPDQSSSYQRRGNSYHVLGDYSQAIVDFTEAIRLNPNNPILFELRGLSRDAQGYRDEAQIDIDTADRISKSVDDPRHENETCSLHPNALEPETIIIAADETLLEINQNLNRSNSLDEKYFHHCSNCMFTYESERTQSDKRSACPQCGKLPQSRIGGEQLDSSTEFFDTYQTAFDHYNGGRYQKAIDLLTKTIRMLPNVTAHDLSETPFYLLRGICYHEFGDSRRAISDLVEGSRAGSEHYLWRAIFCEPSNANDYALRGLGFFVEGDLFNALKDFDIAIEKHLNILSQCHYGRGLCMCRLGSHVDAIVSLTIAIRADRNSGDARSARGWSYFETGEYFKAERDFYLAVQRRHNDADALCGLGWIAHKRGDVEKAKRIFKEAESYGEFILAKKMAQSGPVASRSVGAVRDNILRTQFGPNRNSSVSRLKTRPMIWRASVLAQAKRKTGSCGVSNTIPPSLASV